MSQKNSHVHLHPLNIQLCFIAIIPSRPHYYWQVATVCLGRSMQKQPSARRFAIV